MLHITASEDRKTRLIIEPGQFPILECDMDAPTNSNTSGSLFQQLLEELAFQIVSLGDLQKRFEKPQMASSAPPYQIADDALFLNLWTMRKKYATVDLLAYLQPTLDDIQLYWVKNGFGENPSHSSAM